MKVIVEAWIDGVSAIPPIEEMSIVRVSNFATDEYSWLVILLV